MGIFSKIKEKVSSAIGAAVSKVGEILNSPAVARVGANLEGRTSHVVQTIGVSKALDPKKDSIQESQRINDTLAEYAFSLKAEIKDMEDALVIMLDSFHNVVQNMSDDDTIRKRINLDYHNMRDSVKVSFSDHVSRRMSAADSECREIMQMRPSQEKANRMDAFSRRVLREAALYTSTKIRIMLTAQNERLKSETTKQMDIQANLLRKNSRELDKIRKERASLTAVQKKLKKHCDDIIDEADTINSLIQSADDDTSVSPEDVPVAYDEEVPLD